MIHIVWLNHFWCMEFTVKIQYSNKNYVHIGASPILTQPLFLELYRTINMSVKNYEVIHFTQVLDSLDWRVLVLQ